MLQVDSNARMKANLSMLQRLDPEITDVLESATHVTMYQFDPTTSKWDRYDCEGPLFIVKRGSAPRFNLTIVNRLSRTNFMRPVTSAFHVELVEPYLIFKDSPEPHRTVIHGIWFPDDRERQNIFDMLRRSINAQAPADNSASSVFGGSPAPPTEQQQQPMPPVPPTSAVEQQRFDDVFNEDAGPSSSSPPSSSSSSSSADAGSAGSWNPSLLLTPSTILGKGNVPTFESLATSKLSPEEVKDAVISLIEEDDSIVDQIYARIQSQPSL